MDASNERAARDAVTSVEGLEEALRAAEEALRAAIARAETSEGALRAAVARAERAERNAVTAESQLAIATAQKVYPTWSRVEGKS
jgi:20S proteasome alpha/beta subunit